MKIGLIIYGSLDIMSGGYYYDCRLAKSLRDFGHTVEIISLPWRNYLAHLTDNIHFRLPPGFDILIQDELNHPSLIIANSQPHPCPVISLVHHLRSSELRSGWQNTFYRSMEKYYLREVDGFIFNSKTTSKTVSKLVEVDKPSVVAYPPVDRFGKAIPEEEISERSAQQTLRLVFLGNIIPRKGLHTLLDAIAALLQQSLGAKRINSKHRVEGHDRDSTSYILLDIIGSSIFEPQYARSMRKKVHKLGLGSIVHFHGTSTSDQIGSLLRNAHLLAIPSSYEGYGIAYLEGMCFGLPAVGTTSGAGREIITDGQDGFLIASDDGESLKERLELLAGNRSLLLKMSLAARKRYLEQPAWDRTAIDINIFLRSMAI